MHNDKAKIPQIANKKRKRGEDEGEGGDHHNDYDLPLSVCIMDLKPSSSFPEEGGAGRAAWSTTENPIRLSFLALERGRAGADAPWRTTVLGDAIFFSVSTDSSEVLIRVIDSISSLSQGLIGEARGSRTVGSVDIDGIVEVGKR